MKLAGGIGRFAASGFQRNEAKTAKIAKGQVLWKWSSALFVPFATFATKSARPNTRDGSETLGWP